MMLGYESDYVIEETGSTFRKVRLMRGALMSGSQGTQCLSFSSIFPPEWIDYHLEKPGNKNDVVGRNQFSSERYIGCRVECRMEYAVLQPGPIFHNVN